MRIISIAMLLLATIATSADTIPLKKLAQHRTCQVSGKLTVSPTTKTEPYLTPQSSRSSVMPMDICASGRLVLARTSWRWLTATATWISRNMPGVSIFKIAKGEKEMSGKWMALPSATWEVETLTYIAPLPVKRKIGDA